MYRFIQHRCQEKNDTYVKKRSTPIPRRRVSGEDRGEQNFAAKGNSDHWQNFSAAKLRAVAPTKKCVQNFFLRFSAFDDIQREPREAGLLVARLHIEAGEIHGSNHLIE